MLMLERKRRFIAFLIMCIAFFLGVIYEDLQTPKLPDNPANTVIVQENIELSFAEEALKTVPIKGRAPRTGYSRSQFGQGWAHLGACDVRNHVLKRDLTDVKTRSDTDCTVLSGTLTQNVRWWLAGLAVLAALGYGALEWRNEIANFARRLRLRRASE